MESLCCSACIINTIPSQIPISACTGNGNKGTFWAKVGELSRHFSVSKTFWGKKFSFRFTRGFTNRELGITFTAARQKTTVILNNVDANFSGEWEPEPPVAGATATEPERQIEEKAAGQDAQEAAADREAQEAQEPQPSK